ncbi:hypothetical protein GQ53DRAFT_772313 [Thozetella sp. PMI_491]|nr:hypothetical protein GQ53DRAFT_772313 [Thozetella sp. PMI_491]
MCFEERKVYTICLSHFNIGRVTEGAVLNYWRYKNSHGWLHSVPATDVPRAELFLPHSGLEEASSERGELSSLAEAIKVDDMGRNKGAADAMGFLQKIRKATLLAARQNAISDPGMAPEARQTQKAAYKAAQQVNPSPSVPVAVFVPRLSGGQDRPRSTGKASGGPPAILEGQEAVGLRILAPTGSLYQRRWREKGEISSTVQGLMDSNLAGLGEPERDLSGDLNNAESSDLSLTGTANKSRREEPLLSCSTRSVATPLEEVEEVVRSKTPPLHRPKPTRDFVFTRLLTMGDSEAEVRFGLGISGGQVNGFPQELQRARSADEAWAGHVEVSDSALQASSDSRVEEERVVPPRAWSSNLKQRLVGLEKAITPGCFCAEDESPGPCIPCIMRRRAAEKEAWF